MALVATRTVDEGNNSVDIECNGMHLLVKVIKVNRNGSVKLIFDGPRDFFIFRKELLENNIHDRNSQQSVSGISETLTRSQLRMEKP